MTQTLPARRRLYLMRHGSVDYFLDDGTPVPPDTVPLNATGRAQADAAGALFAASAVTFDRVLVSGLPRTLETAQRVLAAASSATAIETEPALQEIRPGRLSDLPRDQVRTAFLGAFEGGTSQADVESHRFLGGESVGELLDRSLPAWAQFLMRDDWDCALVVLHGGVNRALLSSALAGTRAFFGRIEQAPACINVLDIGADHVVVRAMNLSPSQWLHHRERQTTMEKLLAQYLRT
ncbi:histidine phosphatase family protein [Sphaerotilus sp.]|uniref:histidine phosphatase family protein n=1 Tax=Sphaerotilus sp. TaxID=2093942 RepID=UPI002ACE63CE|nr:histidine phosphatase family protein [Sphaerotilus sp.]MDZ7858569.1 histidine phosphatase family protein [Sphaerotilus sp.]